MFALLHVCVCVCAELLYCVECFSAFFHGSCCACWLFLFPGYFARLPVCFMVTECLIGKEVFWDVGHVVCISEAFSIWWMFVLRIAFVPWALIACADARETDVFFRADSAISLYGPFMLSPWRYPSLLIFLYIAMFACVYFPRIRCLFQIMSGCQFLYPWFDCRLRICSIGWFSCFLFGG